MKKLKLKRHGSFSIRDGWFEKAINKIDKNDKSIFGKSVGVSSLGIGANMVSSLRYWLLASGIIDTKNKLTEFGNLLLKYDRYLESNFSWWLIHYNLVSNEEEAPVFNVVFNNFKAKSFTKETVVNFLKNYVEENDIDKSNINFLGDDVTILLRTYIEEKIQNPEDNLNSPLGRLNILSKGVDNLYSFKKPSFESLNYLVVYYVLEKLSVFGSTKDVSNIDDVINAENSPVKIFKIDKSTFYQYLNEMSKNELVVVNRTAGLNTIYLQKKLSLESIFTEFFERSEEKHDIF